MVMGEDSTAVLVASASEELPGIVAHLGNIGVDAVTACDDAEVWRLLSKGRFWLLLIDLDLPGLRVEELISFARQQPRTRHMPVIVMGVPNDSRLGAAFDAGAGSVLTKPLHWSVFEHHIEVALRMVTSAARLRAQAQQSVATSRANEALLGNVCSEMKTTASVVRDEIERIWRCMPSSWVSQTVAEGLHRIAREVATLQDIAGRAEELVDEVGQTLALVERPESIKALIERTLDGIEPFASNLGVRLVSDLPETDIVVTCDPAAVELALRHVLHNAVVYSPSDSNVSISASVYPDGLLAIDVTDEGEGMHPDYVARCLTPFKAASAGGISVDGRLCFGLPLAKAIMEAHDGVLEIRSMPGEGTTALLILPAERVVVPDQPVIPASS